MFGIPGGANLPIYDAIYNSSLIHIQAAHEQGAGHMAEGYAKASGKIGVAFATSGPGATNLVTAIADAMMDSVPVLFITGQVRTDLLGTDGFQEADILGITMPVVKHSFLIESPGEVGKTIKEAVHIASSGRPGPVLVDIPTDLARAEIDETEPGLIRHRSDPKVHINQIKKAADLINKSSRPIVYSGGGALNASKEIREFVQKGQFPITSTLMGLGAYPAPDPLWLGMLGMHGTYAANWAMDEADVIIAIGARFDDRITGKLSEFAKTAKIIHIDIDPAEINKNVDSIVPIVGDCKEALDLLTNLVQKIDLSSWWETINGWQKEHPLRYGSDPDIIYPQQAIEAIYNATSGQAIVTSDVGQHQMWTAQFYNFSYPRQWINSGGLGTMGFGLPAAIGAKIGCPSREVICIAGDGSLPMVVGEMMTAAMENVDISLFLINNKNMGMVRQWQEMFWQEHYIGIETTSPNWVEIARGFNWRANLVRDPEDLKLAIEKTREHTGPALLDIHVKEDENCYPMIPPGAAARDMIG